MSSVIDLMEYALLREGELLVMRAHASQAEREKLHGSLAALTDIGLACLDDDNPDRMDYHVHIGLWDGYWYLVAGRRFNLLPLRHYMERAEYFEWVEGWPPPNWPMSTDPMA